MVAEGEDRERVLEEVDRLVADMPMLRKTYGKMVYELRPSVDWHKGKAVEWLMEQFKKTSEDIFPVYAAYHPHACRHRLPPCSSTHPLDLPFVPTSAPRRLASPPGTLATT